MHLEYEYKWNSALVHLEIFQLISSVNFATSILKSLSDSLSFGASVWSQGSISTGFVELLALTGLMHFLNTTAKCSK
jgi:hypothetical protein